MGPIDAMGCQYAIADQIIHKEGDYIFSLKGNQGTLCEDVTTYLSNNELKILNNISSFKDHDKGHGRIETRQCWVTHEVAWLRDRHPHWHSINSLIRIDSVRETKDKTTYETRYYISSLKEIPILPVTFLKDNIFRAFQEVEDGIDGIREGLSHASLKLNQALFKDGIEGTA